METSKTDEAEVKPKLPENTKSIVAVLFGGAVIIFVFIAIALYYLIIILNQANISETKVVSLINIGKSNAWKSFKNSFYSFLYPADWSVSQTDYLHTTRIDNPKKNVSVVISEGQYPYGFGGESKTTSLDIQVTVNGKEYTAKEITIDNTRSYVNLDIGDGKHHHILFGTGYPASSDNSSSLEDYRKEYNNIMKILADLKFLD